MKIIGKTDTGYIVYATGDELAQAAGYYSLYSARGKISGLDDRSITLPIGAEINVTKTHRYLEDLRNKDAEVSKSVTLLRALADMLHSALPTTIVPPSDDV